MGSCSFPEIPCALCSNAVNLISDLFADENGRAVHEDCYVQRIASSSVLPARCGNDGRLILAARVGTHGANHALAGLASG